VTRAGGGVEREGGRLRYVGNGGQDHVGRTTTGPRWEAARVRGTRLKS
jgi:hypothetical protein